MQEVDVKRTAVILPGITDRVCLFSFFSQTPLRYCDFLDTFLDRTYISSAYPARVTKTKGTAMLKKEEAVYQHVE
jgi:hypothetical protein